MWEARCTQEGTKKVSKEERILTVVLIHCYGISGKSRKGGIFFGGGMDVLDLFWKLVDFFSNQQSVCVCFVGGE